MGCGDSPTMLPSGFAMGLHQLTFLQSSEHNRNTLYC